MWTILITAWIVNGYVMWLRTMHRREERGEPDTVMQCLFMLLVAVVLSFWFLFPLDKWLNRAEQYAENL